MTVLYRTGTDRYGTIGECVSTDDSCPNTLTYSSTYVWIELLLGLRYRSYRRVQ